MNNLTDIRSAAKSIFSGKDPETVVDELITERPVGRPEEPYGASLGTLANTALFGVSVWKLFQAAARTSDQGLAGRGVAALVGGALIQAKDILANKVTGATFSALGGQEAVSGRGVALRHSMTFNVPTTNITKTVTRGGRGGIGGGPGGKTVTTTIPTGQQAHFAGVYVNPDTEGYQLELYREDPETGVRIGAPVRTYNLSITGATPANIRKMQDSIARTIADIGQGMIQNKTIYRPPIIVYRRPPGRPHFREYRR